MTELLFLDRDGGEKMAYRKAGGAGPGVVWLGGFRADMGGTKASVVADWADRKGRALLLFDYFGHGNSTGDFEAGTISRWRDDALAALDTLTEGPQILAGSSMGGWIATLLAHARPERIAGMLLIAPASDFTEKLMWDLMPEEAKREIIETGRLLHTSDYDGESFAITRALIEDGRKNLVLDRTLEVSYPVRILQGMNDRDVPWQHSLSLVEKIEGDVRLILVKNGDHRLSAPPHLKLLERTLDALVEDIHG
jgi:pimeloyl-ACP methyl ester carboxylesterase